MADLTPVEVKSQLQDMGLGQLSDDALERLARDHFSHLIDEDGRPISFSLEDGINEVEQRILNALPEMVRHQQNYQSLRSFIDNPPLQNPNIRDLAAQIDIYETEILKYKTEGWDTGRLEQEVDRFQDAIMRRLIESPGTRAWLENDINRQRIVDLLDKPIAEILEALPPTPEYGGLSDSDVENLFKEYLPEAYPAPVTDADGNNINQRGSQPDGVLSVAERAKLGPLGSAILQKQNELRGQVQYGLNPEPETTGPLAPSNDIEIAANQVAVSMYDGYARLGGIGDVNPKDIPFADGEPLKITVGIPERTSRRNPDGSENNNIAEFTFLIERVDGPVEGDTTIQQFGTHYYRVIEGEEAIERYLDANDIDDVLHARHDDHPASARTAELDAELPEPVIVERTSTSLAPTVKFDQFEIDESFKIAAEILQKDIPLTEEGLRPILERIEEIIESGYEVQDHDRLIVHALQRAAQLEGDEGAIFITARIGSEIGTDAFLKDPTAAAHYGHGRSEFTAGFQRYQRYAPGTPDTIIRSLPDAEKLRDAGIEPARLDAGDLNEITKQYTNLENGGSIPPGGAAEFTNRETGQSYYVARLDDEIVMYKAADVEAAGVSSVGIPKIAYNVFAEPETLYDVETGTYKPNPAYVAPDPASEPELSARPEPPAAESEPPPVAGATRGSGLGGVAKPISLRGATEVPTVTEIRSVGDGAPSIKYNEDGTSTMNIGSRAAPEAYNNYAGASPAVLEVKGPDATTERDQSLDSNPPTPV